MNDHIETFFFWLHIDIVSWCMQIFDVQWCINSSFPLKHFNNIVIVFVELSWHVKHVSFFYTQLVVQSVVAYTFIIIWDIFVFTIETIPFDIFSLHGVLYLVIICSFLEILVHLCVVGIVLAFESMIYFKELCFLCL
jgi:hypothetical protein